MLGRIAHRPHQQVFSTTHSIGDTEISATILLKQLKSSVLSLITIPQPENEPQPLQSNPNLTGLTASITMPYLSTRIPLSTLSHKQDNPPHTHFFA